MEYGDGFHAPICPADWPLELLLCSPDQKQGMRHSCSGSDIDKFTKLELTSLKAKSVEAPLIKECIANIECRVVDYIKKHDIFVLDAVHAWVDKNREEQRTFHYRGDGTFITDGETINYRKLMRSKLAPGV